MLPATFVGTTSQLATVMGLLEQHQQHAHCPPPTAAPSCIGDICSIFSAVYGFFNVSHTLLLQLFFSGTAVSHQKLTTP